MSDIEWTDATWNPVRGCSRVSEGCRNCYAERMAARNLPEMRSPTTGKAFAQMGVTGPRWTGKVELIPSKLDEPLRWRKPRRVFVNSMSDLFHEALADEAIDQILAVMALAGLHTFQILTKRPRRMLAYMDSRRRHASYWKSAAPMGWTLDDYAGTSMLSFPLPNVWLGVSVEDQATADERIPLLLQTPAAVRFVSYEPALGPVDFRPFLPCRECRGEGSVPVMGGGAACGACFDWAQGSPHRGPYIDWVIVGGESGPGARPFDVAWARSTVEQCLAAGVACFVKQLGSRPRFDELTEFADWLCSSIKNPKGGDPSEWPADLRVREFPEQREKVKAALGGR